VPLSYVFTIKTLFTFWQSVQENDSQINSPFVELCLGQQLCSWKYYKQVIGASMRSTCIVEICDIKSLKDMHINEILLYTIQLVPIIYLMELLCWQYIVFICVVGVCVIFNKGILVPIYWIRVITKLPNSEQSYKGKVKTHKYINTKSVNNRN
jgi:hypothetical protein